jgi:hypothetical protein
MVAFNHRYLVYSLEPAGLLQRIINPLQRVTKGSAKDVSASPNAACAVVTWMASHELVLGRGQPVPAVAVWDPAAGAPNQAQWLLYLRSTCDHH